MARHVLGGQLRARGRGCGRIDGVERGKAGWLTGPTIFYSSSCSPLFPVGVNYMGRVGGVSALSLVLRHQIILEEDRHIFSLIFYDNNNFNAFNVPMCSCSC